MGGVCEKYVKLNPGDVRRLRLGTETEPATSHVSVHVLSGTTIVILATNCSFTEKLEIDCTRFSPMLTWISSIVKSSGKFEITNVVTVAAPEVLPVSGEPSENTIAPEACTYNQINTIT